MGCPSGTGWQLYFYSNKSDIKIKEAYIKGEPVYSAWFKPDGSLVAEQRWVDGNGVQHDLREDGSVKTKMPMVRGRAEGIATYFAADGSVEKYIEFKGGQPFSESKVSDYAAAMSALESAKDDYARWTALGRAAKESINAGKDEDARKFAEELERLAPQYTKDWNYGNAVQNFNIVLGRLAL